VFSVDEGSGSHLSKSRTSRILIVEDDYLIAGEMESELAAAGFEVVAVVASAKEAIRLAVGEKPHLVVMDIRLEGDTDGIDAAIEIFKRCGVRCVFASAYYSPDARLRATTCSPLGWLAKPYTMRSLVEAVETALRELGR
jgi:DNA-binding NarL/FixJ family response regulator